MADAFCSEAVIYVAVVAVDGIFVGDCLYLERQPDYASEVREGFLRPKLHLDTLAAAHAVQHGC